MKTLLVLAILGLCAFVAFLDQTPNSLVCAETTETTTVSDENVNDENVNDENVNDENVNDENVVTSSKDDLEKKVVEEVSEGSENSDAASDTDSSSSSSDGILKEIIDPSISIEKLGDEDNYPVNIRYGGELIRFPYFGKEIREIDERLNELLIKHMDQLFKYLGKFFDDNIEKGPSFYASAVAGKDLFNLGRKQKKERLTLNKPVALDFEFKSSQKKLFADLMSRSAEIEAKMKDYNKKHKSSDPLVLWSKNKSILREDCRIFFAKLRAGFSTSKVGTYVNWDQGTFGVIDKETQVEKLENFKEYASKIMARLSLNGFSKLLFGIKTLVNFIMTFSRS